LYLIDLYCKCSGFDQGKDAIRAIAVPYLMTFETKQERFSMALFLAIVREALLVSLVLIRGVAIFSRRDHLPN
jgi:hypothetical protein